MPPGLTASTRAATIEVGAHFVPTDMRDEFSTNVARRADGSPVPVCVLRPPQILTPHTSIGRGEKGAWIGVGSN
jgi:hypothetical protein